MRKKSCVFILSLSLAAFGLLFLAAAGFAIQLTDNAADEGGSDLAADPGTGALHAVYERAGNIYYWSQSGTSGGEEHVAAGNGPAVAVDAGGVPHVVFIASGVVSYTKRTEEGWEAPAAIHSGSYADIDVDPSGTVHIVYQGDTDGGGYDDIGYTNNSGGSFAAPVVAINGWYEYWGSGSATGRYYSLPSIKADAAGFYHIAAAHHAIDRGMGWTDHNYTIVYTTNLGSFDADAGYFGNNPGVTKTKSAIALTGNGYEIVYYAGGTVYRFPQTVLAAGSQPAVSADSGGNLHVAYVNAAGGIDYLLNTGAGFSLPVTLSPVSTGRNPAVVSEDGLAAVAYEAQDATPDFEVFLSLTGPVAAVSPAAHDFGSAAAGSAPVARVFTITSAGTEDVTLNAIQISDEDNFLLDAAGCGELPAALSPGTSCTVTVSFAPQSAGVLNAELTVALGEEDEVTVPLRGEGYFQYTVTAAAAGGGSGVVSSNVGGILYGYPATSSGTTSPLPGGTRLVLTATANVGTTATWEDCAAAGGTAAGNGTGTATCTFADLAADGALTVSFSAIQYAISGLVTGGHGTLACTTPVAYGGTSTCTAAPDAGYHLQTLHDNGVEVTASVTDNRYQVSAVNGDHEVAAVFAINVYTVNGAAPGGNGTVGCDSPVNHGGRSVCTIAAAAGYRLASLTDNGNNVLGSVSGNGYTISGVSENHEVVAAFNLLAADLAVTVSGAPNPAVAGGTVVYTVSIRNNGPERAEAVVLTDALPAGGQFVSAAPTQGTCDQSGGTVTCNIGKLASGEGAGVSVSLVVSEPGSLSNTVTVSGASGDPNPVDNASTAVTQVEAVDTNPEPFSFTDRAGVPLNALIESSPIEVAGINSPAPIAITGGEYAVNGGPYTSLPGTVESGDTVRVRLASAGDFTAVTEATLTVGGVSDTFSVTTAGPLLLTAFHLPSDQFFSQGGGNLGQYGWEDSMPLAWDYDGDGQNEISFYHIPTNQWFVRGYPDDNLGQYGWGGEESIPVPGDYDGDGRMERAFYHAPSNRWFIEGREPISFGWGGTDCIPLPGDYDGDGVTDLVLYHLPSNQWFMYGVGDLGQFGWGGAESIPVPADYDGDGSVDIAVYHAPSNQWFVKGYPEENLGQYGWGGLQSFPVPGDYNGDRKAERGFYRPDMNWWFVEGEADFGWGWGGAEFMPATSQTVILNWFRFLLGRFQ
jgi:uncharacterized repeat protein (TIGR01451 family)